MRVEDNVIRRTTMSPFSLWIRTGRWVPAQVTDPTLEVKFNPNHDPKDGRFIFKDGGGGRQRRGSGRPPRTRARDGSWSGGGFPGGGSFGGAGAGGDGYWMNTAEMRAFHGRHPDLNPYMAQPGETLDQIAASQHTTADRLRQLNGLSAGAALKPGQILALPKTGEPESGKLQNEARNGYGFGIDASGRTLEAEGELHVATKQERSRSNQRQAGGADRRATDDGGHFIAARFGGPSDSFNHFAQDANFNRGAYRELENGWAKDLRAGKHVFVDIVAHYSGASKRPDSLSVRWVVGRDTHSRDLSNEPKGKPRGH